MPDIRVLFVCSGNHAAGISPVIRNQADSLSAQGVGIDFFTIKGHGAWAYGKSIPALRKLLKRNRYDLVHAHYSLSGICAALAVPRKLPVICSLMGSDTQIGGIWRMLIRWFAAKRWRGVIIKSESMNEKLSLKSFSVLPNGVSLERMQPMDRNVARRKIGWDPGKRYVLFLADPERPEKNFKLAREAVARLHRADVELATIGACPHAEVPLYLNGCDVLLLTSLWEGSPNVIKEAMACNRPIVSTDVGDVRRLFGDTRGCFLASFNHEEMAEKLRTALEFAVKEGSTSGRERIRALHLDAYTVAVKIKDIYAKLLAKKSVDY